MCTIFVIAAGQNICDSGLTELRIIHGISKDTLWVFQSRVNTLWA